MCVFAELSWARVERKQGMKFPWLGAEEGLNPQQGLALRGGGGPFGVW